MSARLAGGASLAVLGLGVISRRTRGADGVGVFVALVGDVFAG